MKKKFVWEKSYAGHPVGAVFVHRGIRVRVVQNIRDNQCKDCVFTNQDCRELTCCSCERADKLNVHFERA